MDDVQLREQLSRELAETSPPLGTVVTDALIAGTRTRRRRRFAVAFAGGGVAVVVLAAGVLLAGNLTRPAGTPQQPGGPQLAAHPPAGARQVGPGQKATTGQAVIVLLTELVSSGGAITEVEGSTNDGAANGGFVYDDGHGKATVSAGVSAQAMDYGPDVTGFACPPDVAGFTCVKSVTTEGFEVRTATMGPYATDCTELKCSIKDVRVELKRPDGVYVVIESFSGPFGRGRAATRADTLLSPDQMVAMARDPRWGLTMDASFVDNAQTTVDPKKIYDGRGASPIPHK